jgi:hypothetical protein
LKRLSAGLLEFVAADTRLPPEIALRVMISIGKAVRLSAGTAAAAVYFEKPLEQVTGVEAHAVLEQVAGEGDNPDRVWSACRAALRQAVFLLEPVIIPPTQAGLVTASSRLLDEGEKRAGMFTPVRRGRGRRSRSVNGSNKHLMIEVIYTQTLKNVSRSEAVTIVTGVRSDASRADSHLTEPTLPRRGDHRALRRIVDDLERALPSTAHDARMAAEVRLRNSQGAEARHTAS